jgi:hypothetical protein
MKPKTTPSPLPDTCSADRIQDGALYQWPSTGIQECSTLYSTVAFLDQIVIKLPSSHGFDEYNKYVVKEQADNDAIRGNETIERFQNVDQLLARYPSCRQAQITIGDKKTHWLLLHKLQYDRLKRSIKIPETRFCFFSKKGFLFASVHPGLVQRRVTGISLWDMIDHEVWHEDREHEPFVRQEYESLIPQISAQLAPLATHDLFMHINWYIKNFIFDPKTNILYYLDLKPSNIFGKWRNDQNLREIRRDFLR